MRELDRRTLIRAGLASAAWGCWEGAIRAVPGPARRTAEPAQRLAWRAGGAGPGAWEAGKAS